MREIWAVSAIVEAAPRLHQMVATSLTSPQRGRLGVQPLSRSVASFLWCGELRKAMGWDDLWSETDRATPSPAPSRAKATEATGHSCVYFARAGAALRPLTPSVGVAYPRCHSLDLHNGRC